MKNWLVTSTAVLALLPLQANAERMAYAFLQGTHIVDTDLDQNGGGDDDGDGFGVRFGWIMGPYLHADVRYDDLNYDDVDGHDAAFRFGFHHPIIKGNNDPRRLDWFAQVSYEDLELDGGTALDFDDSGWGLSGGLRFSPADWIELTGELGHLDYGSVDGFEYRADIQLNTSRYFAFVFEYRNIDYNAPGPDLDREDLSVGLRFLFGGG